jgi:hypothetical protein
MTVGLAFRYINLAEGGKSLAEVELRKPRNLFVYVSEKREHAERVRRGGCGLASDTVRMCEQRRHGEGAGCMLLCYQKRGGC